MATGTFVIFNAHSRAKLWQLRFSREAVPDLPFAPEFKTLYGFNAGLTRFMDDGDDPESEAGLFGADREGYKGALWYWQHVDPGLHKYVHALRFEVRNHFIAEHALINDQGMKEDPLNSNTGETQGKLPYPYDRRPPSAVDKRHPGAVIEVMHFRRGSTGTPERQLLQRFTIPAVDGQTRWWYQGRGRLIAVHNTLGPCAKLIISGIHPAYSFRDQRTPTKGADTRN